MNPLYLAAFLLVLPSWAQPSDWSAINGIYLGTLGKQEIVLEIGAVDRNRNANGPPTQPIEGRYFYRKHGVAILVEGMPLSDGSIRIQEYHDRKPGNQEWRLTIANGKGTGFFCKCDVRLPTSTNQQGVPIVLTRVSEGFDPGFFHGSDSNPKDKKYYDLLLDFPLAHGPEIKVSYEIGYEIWKDERFKVGLPHITRFPDPNVMVKVNEELDRELEERRILVAECLQQLHSDGREWKEQVSVSLFTVDILSIERQSSYDCGGAHPDFAIEPLVYNLHTGKILDLKDVFKVQQKSAPLTYGTVPAGASHDLLLQLFLRHNKPLEYCDEDCHKDCHDVIQADTSFQMFFKDEGLVLAPNLAHAVLVCFQEVVIPYAEVRSELKTNWQFVGRE